MVLWRPNGELWQKLRGREKGERGGGKEGEGARKIRRGGGGGRGGREEREERGGGGAEEKENSRFRDRKGTTLYGIVETEQRVVVEGEL